MTAHIAQRREVSHVQPKDSGESHPEDLSNGEKRKARHDQVGQSSNRGSAASGCERKRPRNKRKKFEKGAKALWTIWSLNSKKRKRRTKHW